MQRRLALLALPSLLALFGTSLVACSDSGGDPGGGGVGAACSATMTCAAGLACVAGRCAAGAGMECSASSPCPTGFFCGASGTCEVADAGPSMGVDATTGCGEFPFTVSPGAPPDLVLVIDRSQSMSQDLASGGTKWEALLDAVDGVTHALEASVDFGLAIYPDGGDRGATCTAGMVSIDPATMNADAIMAALRRNGPNGATPTAPTIANVGTYLAMARAGHEGHSPGMILATDGAPNCNADLDGTTCMCTIGGGAGGSDCGGGSFCLDDTRTYMSIDASAAASVPVYVIGLPGSEDYAGVLSEMARRGGTARAGDPAYYAATDGTDLQASLLEIAMGFVSCSFDMDIAPENPRRVQILVDGMDVAHDDTRANGWAYTNDTNTTFEIFGSWCDRLKDGGSHTVTASYACSDLF